MISAILYCRDGEWTGFRAEGHSGYAEEGSDIVCAAVSVLACTCVNSLEKLLGVTVVMHGNEDGLLDFDIPEVPEEKRGGVQLLMGALDQGLGDIQENYPEYLKIKIEGRRKKR